MDRRLDLYAQRFAKDDFFDARQQAEKRLKSIYQHKKEMRGKAFDAHRKEQSAKDMTASSRIAIKRKATK